jgi:hypothetical protein
MLDKFAALRGPAQSEPPDAPVASTTNVYYRPTFNSNEPAGPAQSEQGE